MNQKIDTIIIGAGISGLVAATTIQNDGNQVILLEQSPVVGGRLATYSLDEGLADYGAQFFTSRNPVFQEQVDRWLKSGLVYIWSHEWSDGSVKRIMPDSEPRYATKGGMYQLANYLSSKIIHVHLSTTVKSIQWQDNQWMVTDTSDAIYLSRVLILTPPVPQSLALLADVPLDDKIYQELERIYYKPCLSGLFVVKGEVTLPPSGAVQDLSKSVYWIADNQKKGISDQKRCITMHLGRQYSEKHYNDADATTLQFLRNELEQYLAEDAVIETAVLKKWRYSIPLTTYPFDILKVEEPPLIFAGDAFGGRGRIEGAYLSGLSAGKAVIQSIKST